MQAIAYRLMNITISRDTQNFDGERFCVYSDWTTGKNYNKNSLKEYTENPVYGVGRYTIVGVVNYSVSLTYGDFNYQIIGILADTKANCFRFVGFDRQSGELIPNYSHLTCKGDITFDEFIEFTFNLAREWIYRIAPQFKLFNDNYSKLLKFKSVSKKYNYGYSCNATFEFATMPNTRCCNYSPKAMKEIISKNSDGKQCYIGVIMQDENRSIRYYVFADTNIKSLVFYPANDLCPGCSKCNTTEYAHAVVRTYNNETPEQIIDMASFFA
jgi:hypothetical protein